MRQAASEQGLVLDPALYPLQHGAASGAAPAWVTANTIRIAAGSAWIQGADGLLRPVRWAQTDVTVPNATNTRLDQIVVDLAGVVTRVAGTTDAAGATLDNRNGAAGGYNAGSGYLRLADAVATATGVANSAAGFRDRRPWAKGFRGRVTDPGGQMTIGTSWTNLNTTTLLLRGEFSGKPLKWLLSMNAYVSFSGTGPQGFVLAIQVLMDAGQWGRGAARAVDNLNTLHEWSGELDGPLAGNHVFTLQGDYSQLGYSVLASGARLSIEEDLRDFNPIS